MDNISNEINIPNEEILDLTTNDANEPNLTRVGYPIIIKMNGICFLYRKEIHKLKNNQCGKND